MIKLKKHTTQMIIAYFFMIPLLSCTNSTNNENSNNANESFLSALREVFACFKCSSELVDIRSAPSYP